jgi:type I restriction enzyme, R subunit
MDALILFKSDLAAYVRIYGFLSQIFDYGNTEVEKRSIFFRLLHPLLAFGREREGVDLSALRLTAYSIRNTGEPKLSLGVGEPQRIYVVNETGTGEVQDKSKIALSELIAKINDLFEGELTPGDKLVYVNNVIIGKMLESARLIEQAANNTKEQFNNSPDLFKVLVDAAMDAGDAHALMSRQTLESPAIQRDLLNILLREGMLWERLREKASGASPRP